MSYGRLIGMAFDTALAQPCALCGKCFIKSSAGMAANLPANHSQVLFVFRDLDKLILFFNRLFFFIYVLGL